MYTDTPQKLQIRWEKNINLPQYSKTLEDQRYRLRQDHMALHHSRVAKQCFQLEYLVLQSADQMKVVKMIKAST